MSVKEYDVIIIGGGTAGLFCAYEAHKRGLKVALIEAREKLGEKLRLAGGGMGNMSNRTINEEHYISSNKKEASYLLRSLFRDFTCDDVLRLLEDFNIPYEDREFGQIFCLKPVKEWVRMLENACAQTPKKKNNTNTVHGDGVDFYMSTLVKQVYYTQEEGVCDNSYYYHVMLPENKTQGVFTKNSNKQSNKKLHDQLNIKLNKQLFKHISSDDTLLIEETSRAELIAKNLIIATGSTAYPQIGATDFGLRLAKKWGLSIHAFSPVLVPLSLRALNSVDLSGLEGVSISVRMRVFLGKQVFTDPCDVRPLLFTHQGVSGPACLVISCFFNCASKENNDNQSLAQIEINFLPYIDMQALMHAPENGKKNLKNLLLPLLPDRLAYRLIPDTLQNKKVAELSKKERKSIIERVHASRFYVEKNAGLKKAEAARGGVSVKELKNSFESIKYKGLYFCGEVLDITGLLGGYNIHFALASAKRVAESLET